MEFKRRTWGYYLTAYSAKKFKIKFLYFKKGLSCSFQRHFHRDETWCFLFGNGIFNLRRPESKQSGVSFSYAACPGGYVRVEALDWHQYKAISPTLVLEIQTGDCREDDIERAA